LLRSVLQLPAVPSLFVEGLGFRVQVFKLGVATGLGLAA